jgi:ribonuclease HII
MLLIATDEAGYGPKLGPLVIVATTWRLPDSMGQSPSQEELDDLFACVREPTSCGDDRVVINDSKAVYQSKGKDGLRGLHAAVSAASHWTDAHAEETWSASIEHLVATIANDDLDAIRSSPWLCRLSDEPLLSRNITEPTIRQWSSSGIQLQSIAAKIITARQFNDACESGSNKADLLSESTLGLVRHELKDSNEETVLVYCDRHGGRRFYSGVLQHTFSESLVQVVSESTKQSVYRFKHRKYNAKVHFTVKGDSFTPVAMSSIIAKYLRERLMESLNRYFDSLHVGQTPLKHTAGYPVDADRYLREIDSIILQQKIDPRNLVRER